MANGMIMTQDQAKKSILQGYRTGTGSRTFGSLYTANELAGAKAEQQVEQQYGEQIGQAYKAAMAQRGTVLSSNLGEGYKGALIGDTEAALSKAYDAYMSNIAQSKQKIAAGVSDANAEVDKTVDTIAKNTVDYKNAMFDYYKKIDADRRATMTDDEYREYINSPLWAKYYTLDFSEDADAQKLYDQYKMLRDNGIISKEEFANIEAGLWQYKRLMTEDELSRIAYEEVANDDGTVRREYSSLYDEEGNLTPFGVDFFDQMENYAAGRIGEGQSWEEYLAETNPELLDWAKTYNPYNATDDPYFAGSFRTLTGRTSTDYTYSFMERFGGLTKSQADSAFNKIYSNINKTPDQINVDDIDATVDEFKKIANEIGLSQDDIPWDRISDEIKVYTENYRSAKESVKQKGISAGVGYVAAVLQIITAGILAATGAGIPAAATLASTGLGTLHSAINDTNEGLAYEEVKNFNEDKAQELYLNTVTSMINLLQSKQREAQIEAYRKR